MIEIEASNLEHGRNRYREEVDRYLWQEGEDSTDLYRDEDPCMRQLLASGRRLAWLRLAKDAKEYAMGGGEVAYCVGRARMFHRAVMQMAALPFIPDPPPPPSPQPPPRPRARRRPRWAGPHQVASGAGVIHAL